MNYTGIDLHKDNLVITTYRGKSGKLTESTRLPNDKELILGYFEKIRGKHKAVVESTSSWYWLHDLLDTKGIELELAHAKYLKAISYAKVKTDKVDSSTLANLLRMNLIPKAHKINRENRPLRDTMRARLSFVIRRTSCYNSIHRIAEKFNCDPLVKIDQQIIPEELPEEYKLQMKFLFKQAELLDEQINELEKSLHDILIPNEDIQRLLWIPGFGKITAFSVYLEIDGIERFNDVKKFFSYCRLVPGAKNSNRTQLHKSGCKDGNRYLKVAFTDAAVHAIRYYPEYRAYYQKMLRRSNKAIARTVVAKELARITYYVLKNKTVYKGFKGKPISRQKTLNWPRLANPFGETGSVQLKPRQ
jgi:transposase